MLIAFTYLTILCEYSDFSSFFHFGSPFLWYFFTGKKSSSRDGIGIQQTFSSQHHVRDIYQKVLLKTNKNNRDTNVKNCYWRATCHTLLSSLTTGQEVKNVEEWALCKIKFFQGSRDQGQWQRNSLAWPLAASNITRKLFLPETIQENSLWQVGRVPSLIALLFDQEK